MNGREHLFTCLIEECAEVQKCATKILRFGLNDSYPGYGHNQEVLVAEIVDLMAALELLVEDGVLPKTVDADAVRAKKVKVAKFMEYARENGALDDNSEDGPLRQRVKDRIKELQASEAQHEDPEQIIGCTLLELENLLKEDRDGDAQR